MHSARPTLSDSDQNRSAPICSDLEEEVPNENGTHIEYQLARFTFNERTMSRELVRITRASASCEAAQTCHDGWEVQAR